MSASPAAAETPGVVLRTARLSVFAGPRALLREISLDVPEGKVTAIIGPSGCGKTTLIRSMNRMVEQSPGLRVAGSVLYRGRDIYAAEVSPVMVRRRIGMVFQRPTVFPMTIFENVAFGLRLERMDEDEVEAGVVRSLQRAGLYEEVRDDLDRAALSLSGGQQQRLCIARALAVNPSVLLLDEATASLDPIATQRIEQMLGELKREVTIVIVTHNIAQAARTSDLTVYLHQGHLVEVGPTAQLFEAPKEKLTEEYITGRFG